MRLDDACCGLTPVSEGERKAMSDVSLNGYRERVALVSVKPANLDLSVTAELGRTQPVHAIYNPHGWPVHDDRWQWRR